MRRSLGWTDVEEIPGAVDLWATPPDGRERVVFEVKTISPSNAVHQCRWAVSQLLEYMLFHGVESDCLCAVLTASILDRRRALMEHLGITVSSS